MVAFIMPAIMGGMALYGMIKGSRKSKEEKALTEEQKRARQSMQAKADQAIPTWDAQAGRMEQQGRTVRNRPGMAQALNYWTSMMGGDRAKMLSATAPQRGQINELYGGQARSLDTSNMRGTQKARAQGDLEQQRVASLAGLIQGQAPMAAQQLGQLEGNIDQLSQGWMNMGQQARGFGWSNYGDLMRGAFDMRQAGLLDEQAERQKWSQLGQALAPVAGAGIEAAMARKPTPPMNNKIIGPPGASVPGGWTLPRGQLMNGSYGGYGGGGGWSGNWLNQGASTGFNSRLKPGSFGPL